MLYTNPVQYVILKVSLLSNKIPGKKIDFSWEVHNTEISQMDLLSTMRQCDGYVNESFLMNDSKACVIRNSHVLTCSSSYLI